MQTYYEQAQETINILKSNTAIYKTIAGKTVSLDLTGTETVLKYPKGVMPDITRVQLKHAKDTTKFYLYNKDSYTAAKHFANNGRNTCVLNFASAMVPGGGFLSGANAQEECLCRASTLYASIGSYAAQDMYFVNRNDNNPMYTDYMLYTPKVTVFRNITGEFLDKPYNCSVITAPAVDTRQLILTKMHEVDAEMYKRCLKILAIAVVNGVDNLVLGAWGCGVFGNSPVTVARIFYELLITQNYAAYFDNICFAVYDKRADQTLFNAFKQQFAVCLR